MDMYLGGSSQNVSFSAKLFSFILSENLNSNSIDIVKLLVNKADEYLLKAIVLMSGQIFSLVIWLISDVSYINCTEFEKLRFMAFAAL